MYQVPPLVLQRDVVRQRLIRQAIMADCCATDTAANTRSIWMVILRWEAMTDHHWVRAEEFKSRGSTRWFAARRHVGSQLRKRGR